MGGGLILKPNPAVLPSDPFGVRHSLLELIVYNRLTAFSWYGRGKTMVKHCSVKTITVNIIIFIRA